MAKQQQTTNELKVLKQPAARGPVAMYCVVRNEKYFLPHFLAHYRRLGIGEFWFLDDHSDDGTFEYLQSQRDCGVLRATLRFGDLVDGGQRFGVASKHIVPSLLLKDRWVLTVDADEFLILPEGFETVPELAQALERNQLDSARAVMIDFFPDTLRDLEAAAPDANPFDVSPNFDTWERFEWPDRAVNVTKISLGDSIRPRILAELARRKVDLGFPFSDYKYANIQKAPLAFWHERQQAISAHRLLENPTDRVQMVLAHFKFFPGHRARTRAAVERAVHFNNAVEYRILYKANALLADWPMRGPRTQRFTSRKDFEPSGLLYSRLK